MKEEKLATAPSLGPAAVQQHRVVPIHLSGARRTRIIDNLTLFESRNRFFLFLKHFEKVKDAYHLQGLKRKLRRI